MLPSLLHQRAEDPLNTLVSAPQWIRTVTTALWGIAAQKLLHISPHGNFLQNGILKVVIHIYSWLTTLFHGVYSLFRVSSQKENFLFAPVTNFYIIVHVIYHEKYKNSLQAQIDAILIKSYVNRLFPSHHNGPFKSGVCVRNERVVGSNPISGSNKIKASEKSEAFFLCIYA